MRRFWAFIVMLLTIVVALVFNVQTVYNRTNFGVDYRGGTEIVLRADQRTGSDAVSLNEDDIANKVQERLDLAGARDAEVSVYIADDSGVGPYVNPDSDNENLPSATIRISLPSSATVANVLTLVEGNSPITFTDSADHELAGSTVFQDLDPMSLKYNSTNPIPVFNISNTTAWDNFIDEVPASQSDDGNSSSAKTVYVWQNKTEEDTYALAFGDNARDEVKAKVIATLTTNNFVAATQTENAYISVTSDADGNSFTIASARAYVNARNADDYGFDITYLYQNPITVSSLPYSRTTTMIVSLVSAAIVWAMLIVIYRFSGVLAGLTISLSLLFTWMLSNVLGFEFTPVMLLGLGMTLLLGVLIVVNYYERIKGEIKKGKTLEKANYDGYRKSFPLTVASSVFTFFLALMAFLLGQGETKIFCGVLVIGSFFDFIFVNYVTKWLVYWLTTSSVFARGERAFGFGTGSRAVDKAEKRLEKRTVTADKISKKSVLSFSILGVIALACLGTFLGFGLANGTASYYNYSGDYTGSTRLDISYVTTTDLDQDHTFDDFASFLAYVSDEEGTAYYSSERTAYFTSADMVSDDSYTFNRVSIKDDDYNNAYRYYISVELKKELPSEQYEALKNDFGSGTDLNLIQSSYQKYTTVAMDTSSYGKASYANHFFYLSIGLLPVFVFALVLIGYGLYAAIASLLGSSMVFGLGTLLFALFKLPFTSTSFFGVMAAVLLFGLLVPVFFTYLREEKRDARIANPSIESRALMVNNARARSYWTVSLVSLVSVLFGIALICIKPGELLGAGLSLIFLTALDWYVLLYLLPYLYLFFVRLIRLRPISDKAKARREARLKESNAGPHETIVPGIND